MKVLIIYFSGTGNTYYCANYIKEHLTQNGNEISMYSIENLSKGEIGHYDFLITGFPVYACNVPAVMRNYLEGIPLTAGKGAYIFCTKGFSSGNSLKRASNILKSSGYHISGYADVTMPGSDGLAFLKKDSAAVRKMCNKDFKQIEPLDRLIEKIKNDIKAAESTDYIASSVNIPATVSGVILDAVFKLTYIPVEHWMKGKFWADENCVRCGLCEKICPSHNIEVTDKGVCFDGHCYLCMRCIHQCPQAAIQIGKGTVGKMRWKGPDGKYNPSMLEH